MIMLQAIEFVTMQHDDELWEELIKQCLHKPEMVDYGLLLTDITHAYTQHTRTNTSIYLLFVCNVHIGLSMDWVKPHPF